MSDNNKTTKELFAEWFEGNIKTDTVTADFFRQEDDEEEEATE